MKWRGDGLRMEDAEVVGGCSSPRTHIAKVACCDGHTPLMDALPWGPLGTLQNKVLVGRKEGLTL